MLVALLVCLIPTTIGGLLSAIGIAGMDRLVRRNVLALSGRAVEAAGDCSTLLLDKTGTITLGNRQASEFLPLPRSRGARARRRGPAREPRRRDARGPLDRRPREGALRAAGTDGRRRRRSCRSPPQTRMSGVDVDGRSIRKGAADAIRRWIEAGGGAAPAELDAARRADRVLRRDAARRREQRARRSGSSTSRTSSRKGCATASRSSARWASAR